MSEPLYALTARTAGDLRGLLADGGAVGGRASSAAPVRGVTWVKVTSGTAVSGWYPAVVSVDVGGAFGDLTAAVKVASADGSALTNGTRYLCTRTGDDSDGARFRTPTGNTGGSTSPLTTKGDLYTRSSSANARLAVGSNGQVLTADSAQTNGVKWATPASGGDVFGPSSSTSTGVAVYGNGTGKLIQNTGVTIDSNNNLTVPGLLRINGDGGDSPFGGTLSFEYAGGGIHASLYASPGSGSDSYLYFVTGTGATGTLGNMFIKNLLATYVGATGDIQSTGGRVIADSRFRCANTDGISTSFTVKVGGADKTAQFVGGILVGVS